MEIDTYILDTLAMLSQQLNTNGLGLDTPTAIRR